MFVDARARDDWPADFREAFWQRYPHKIGKQDAMKSLERVRKRGQVTWAALMLGLDRYIRTKPPDRSWCNPATWLNQGRWDDEPSKTGGLFGVNGGGASAAAHRAAGGSVQDRFIAAMARQFARRDGADGAGGDGDVDDAADPGGAYDGPTIDGEISDPGS